DARTHVEPEITPRNRSWARDIGISPCYQSWHNRTTFTETYGPQPVEASGIHPQTRKRFAWLAPPFSPCRGAQDTATVFPRAEGTLAESNGWALVLPPWFPPYLKGIHTSVGSSNRRSRSRRSRILEVTRLEDAPLQSWHTPG